MTSDELNVSITKFAVEAAWGYIESASLDEVENGVEWMNVRNDLENLQDAFDLLVELKLAEVHPQQPTWIREVPA